MSEKELPPTEEKIRQARKKGQLGLSQEVVTLLKLVVVAEMAFALEASFRNGVAQLLSTALQTIPGQQRQPFSVEIWRVFEAAVPLIMIAVSLVLAAAAISWIGTLVQTKMNIAPKAFAESLRKFNPVNNLKQIFSGQKLMMLALGPLKVISLLVVVGFKMWDAIPMILQADRLSAMTVWQASIFILHEMLRSALMVILFWAVLDLGIQRWMNRRNLRMDAQEMKQEYKNMEGDPHAKSFRKATGQEVLMSNGPLPKPAVVVVNPEHFAVALAYDYRPDSVPVVVGKGVDELAAYWRQVAHTAEIPIIRYRSLARQLYATGKVGDFVPSTMLAAVALLFQAAIEAAKESREDGDLNAVYEIDEEIATEMLASAPQFHV